MNIQNIEPFSDRHGKANAFTFHLGTAIFLIVSSQYSRSKLHRRLKTLSRLVLAGAPGFETRRPLYLLI